MTSESLLDSASRVLKGVSKEGLAGVVLKDTFMLQTRCSQHEYDVLKEASAVVLLGRACARGLNRTAMSEGAL